MNVTSVTKHYKRLSLVAALFSFLCVVGPVGFFFCQAMMVATITQKVVLGATAIAGLILGAINLLMKSHARSPFWIVMMAISLFLDKLQVYKLLPCNIHPFCHTSALSHIFHSKTFYARYL